MAAKHPPMDAPSASGAEDGGDESKVHDLLSHRMSLESTLPPTPLKELLAAGGATVYVLSADAALLDVVYRAGGEQYPIFTVGSWNELEAAIAAGRCNIALLDAEHLGQHLVRRLAELERYAGRLVTLVAATREQSQQLIGYLSDRKIHRLLIKPAALGITRLLLESAVGRALQLRGEAAEAAEAEPIFADDRRQRGKSAGAGGRWPAWLLATGVVSLAIAVLVVGGLTGSLWLTPEPPAQVTNVRSSAPEPTMDVRAPEIVTTGEAPEVVRPVDEAAPETAAEADTQSAPVQQNAAPVPEPASATPDRFAELLQSASSAVAEGRLAEPSGDNALDYYLTVLVAEPEHVEARAGLEVVIDALFTRAEGALLDDDLDVAAATLEHVRRAEPSSARLAFLEAQLERSRRSAADGSAAPGGGAAAAAASAASELPGGELESLLTLAAARLERGQLLEPAGDSAREYIDRAAAAAPQDERVAAARADLAAALLAAASAAVRGDDLGRAVALRGAALEQGVSAQALVALDAAIDAGRERQAAERQSMLVQLARERLERGALIAPEEDSALRYVAMLRAENAAHAELGALTAELEGAIATSARAALDARDWTSAETWLAGWTRLAPESAAPRAFADDLAAERQQQAFLTEAVPASALPLVEYEPPEYPSAALRDGIEGSVTLEYTVGRDGRTRDIVIAESEPPGRFDEAALEAVQDYVYQPFELDGRTYERRVRLRLTFSLR